MRLLQYSHRHVCRPLRWLSLPLILVLLLTPVVALGQGTEDQPEPSVHLGADQVILINRNDGRIVIQDPKPQAGSVDLSGKYDVFGGPYYDVAAGDFNGDGQMELVAIGGFGVNTPGPNLNTLDPVKLRAGLPQLPQLSADINPHVWTMVRTGDLDGNGDHEIVALRTAWEPPFIKARIMAFDFDTRTGRWVTLWDLPTAGGFLDMAPGDFDGDGADDIVLARDGRIIIVIDGRSPTVTHFQAEVGQLASWTKARIGNVDAEPGAELILLRPQPVTAGDVPAAIVVIKPTSFSTWEDKYQWGLAHPPVDISLSDVDRDGVQEIMALSTGTDAAIYTLNPRRGGVGGNIQEHLVIGDNLWGPRLAMGDANGDGRPERMLVLRNGAFLRIWSFHPDSSVLDVATNGPYWENFTAANLVGAGIPARPRLRVPNEVALFYDLSTSAGTVANLRLENIGAGTFDWMTVPSPSCVWLNLSPTVGSAGGVLSFSVYAPQLPSTGPGTRVQCSVGIRAEALDGPVLDNNQTITVQVKVVSKLEGAFLPLVFH